MSKSIRLNQQHAKTDAELLNALHASAKKYSMFADNKLLYIYRANTKNAPYKCYEVFFGRDNFIHLVGFKRDKINATQFFEKCNSQTIQLHEATFKENRKAASAKLEAIEQLLDYRHVKIYKIGNADLIKEKNKFEVGLGNASGIIGFDRRKPLPALPIPVTVMKRPITDYASTPENVLAILMKEKTAGYYNIVVGCVAKGLPTDELPEDIRSRLAPNLFPIISNPKQSQFCC